jgi:putative endonuclease
MTNKINTVLYVGVSSNLEGRVWQHKNKFFPKSFTAQYNVNKLVYAESYDNPTDAICREKQLKAGSRKKKIDLIIMENPEFNDLSSESF